MALVNKCLRTSSLTEDCSNLDIISREERRSEFQMVLITILIVNIF